MSATVLFAILSVHLVQSTRYYVGVSSTENYNEAKSSCQNFQVSFTYNGELATWDDNNQYNQIVDAKNRIPANRVWVGLDDLNTEGRWKMIDGNNCGSDCDNIPQWDAGEPNDHGTEDCAEITTNGLLNDVDCGTGRYFICAVDLNSNPDSSRFVQADGNGYIPDMNFEPDRHGNYYAIFEFDSIGSIAFLVSILLNIIFISCTCYIFAKNIGKKQADYSKVKMYATEDERL